jgi:hypothetical protein
MPFVKGQSGNPGGRPKVNPEVQALLDEFTPEAIRTLGEIMRDVAAQASARITAAMGILKKSLPDLASHEHTGDLMSFVARIPSPEATSDEWQTKHSPPTIQ